MANLVETTTLNLDGSAIDGTAARGAAGTSDAVKNLQGNLKQLASDTGATAQLNSVSGALGDIQSKLVGLATTYLGFTAIKGMVADIMTATKAHEELAISIAATMAVANGWPKSLETANDTLEKLHKTASLVGSSVATMTDTFTMLKRTFGGLSTDATDMTQRLALLAKQSGTTADSLAYTLARMAQTGLAPRMSLAGLALINIDPKVLQTMKDAGQGLDYLKAKIAGNTAEAEVLTKTWSYLGASLSDVKEHALVLVGQGFEPLKAVLKSMTDQLDSLESQHKFENIGTAIRALSTFISDLVTDAKSNVPLWLEALEAMVQGVFSAVTRMIAGWQTYKIITQGLAISLFGSTPEERMGAIGNVEEQLDALAAKTNATIAKIMLIPQVVDLTIQTAVSHATLGVDAKLGAISTAREVPNKPSGDKTKKNADAILQTIQDMWAKADAYYEEGLQAQLDMLDVQGNREIAKYKQQAKDGAITHKEATDAALAVQAETAAHQDSIRTKHAEEVQKFMEKLQDDLAEQVATGEEKQTAAVQKGVNSQLAEMRKLALGDGMTPDQQWKATTAIVEAGLAKQVADRNATNKQFEDADRDLQMQLLANADDTYTKESATYAKTYQDYVTKLADPLDKKSQEQKDTLIAHAQAVYASNMATMQMGLVGVQSNLKSMEDFNKGAWDAMGQAFQTGFYDLLTGKFGDLVNVLKSFWDSILQDFSKMLANMLKNWIYTQLGMTQSGGGTGGKPGILGSLTTLGGQQAQQGSGSMGTGGYFGDSQDNYSSQQWGGGGTGALGAYGALAAGLYMGASATTTAMGKNTQPYQIAGQTYTGDFGGNAKFGDFIPAVATLAIAATAAYVEVFGAAIAASAVPIVGWIAAAALLIVGAILAIFNGPKEAQVSMATSQMQDPTSQIGNAMWASYGQTMGSLMQTNRLGGGSSADFAQYMNANLPGTESWQTKLHAGSGDDLTKDAETFFKTILPRMNIEQAFGQTWTGGYHGDQAGGVAGSEGIAGISGVPTMIAGSFDPDAPIPKMLKGLGMTATEISGIAKQIDVQDPERFLTWLGSIVGVVQSFKTVIGDLNKSWVDIQKDQQDLVRNGGADALKIQSGNVIDAAGSMSDAMGMLGGGVVGDAQIKQAQDLIALSQQYYDNAKAALKVLTDMMNSVKQTASDFGTAVAQVGKNADWLRSDRTNRLGLTGGIGPGGQYGPELANDTNTADVQKTWDAFMKDANAQLQFLVGVLDQVNTGMAAMAGTALDFDNIQKTATRDLMDVSTITGDYNDLMKLVGATGKMQDKNGTDYLKSLGLIQQGTQGLYQETLAFIQAVNSAQKGLNTGVAADIWQNNYQIAGNDDKGGQNASQIGMIKSKIQEDLAKIQSATDPTVVTQYAGEIRGLLGTYEGFFKPGDPKYDEAYQWANSVLGQLQKTGTESLTGMGASAGVIAAAMGTGGESMQTAQALFQTALDVANVALGLLNERVTAFSGLVNTKLAEWADTIGTDMKAAGAALTKAMNDFTLALGGDPAVGTGGGGAGPDGSGPGGRRNDPIAGLQNLGSATNDAVLPMNNFTAAVNLATHALSGK